MSHSAPMRTFMWLQPNAIRVGDIITNLGSGIPVTGDMLVREISSTAHPNHFWFEDGVFYLYPPVVGPFGVMRLTDPEPVPTNSPMWNSKCGLCGGNIYVGFANIEHEGNCRG